MATLKIRKGEFLARNGQRIRVYAVDGAGHYCVHGAFKGAMGWFHGRWDMTGEYSATVEPELDIVARRKWYEHTKI